MKTEDPPKGFILAAGFGTRLKPLTDDRPKPLMSLCGVSLLDLALWRLRSAEITELAVNAHYLAPMIQDAVKRSPLGKGVQISIEAPEILGRGGAFKPLHLFWADRDIVVYNGDVVSDIDVSAVIAAHRKAGAMATMVLLPKPLGRDKAVFVKNQKIIAIANAAPQGAGGDVSAHGFACMQVISQKFLELLPKADVSDILEAYDEAFVRGETIGAYVHHGFWHDVGSPQQYLEAEMDVLSRGFGSERLGIREVHKLKGETFTFYAKGESGSAPFKWTGPALVNHSAQIHPTAEIGPMVIVGAHSVVGKNAKINRSVLLEHSGVKSGEVVSQRIVTAKTSIQLAYTGA